MKNSSTNLNLMNLRWRNYPLVTGLANVANSLQNSKAVTIATAGHGDNPVVTWNAHRMVTDDFIGITGADLDPFNGKVFKVTVINANTFSIHVIGAEALGNPAGAIATWRCMAQSAHIYADVGNAADISFGGDSLADFDVIHAGQVYVLTAPHGAKFDLADIFVKSTSATQTVKVLFI